MQALVATQQPSCRPTGATTPSPRRRNLYAARRGPTPTYAARPPTVAAAGSVEDLPANLAKIVGSFQSVPDSMQRYKQLLYLAAKLKGFPEEARVEDNKVPGCVSQVWVQPRIEGDLVYFTADSDSQLTKGLAALLVVGLSGE